MLVSGQQSRQDTPSSWRELFRAPRIRLLLQILLLSCSMGAEGDQHESRRLLQKLRGSEKNPVLYKSLAELALVLKQPGFIP